MKKDKKKESKPAKSEEIDYLAQLQRLQAEFINYRTRVEKEKQSIANTSREVILCKLLEVKDNFDRAPKLDEGMEMIYNQFLSIFEDESVIEMDVKEFDPHFHEAIATDANVEQDKIVEVFQKGYLRKDKVMRPAKVIVGSKEKQK